MMDWVISRILEGNSAAMGVSAAGLLAAGTFAGGFFRNLFSNGNQPDRVLHGVPADERSRLAGMERQYCALLQLLDEQNKAVYFSIIPSTDKICCNRGNAGVRLSERRFYDYLTGETRTVPLPLTLYLAADPDQPAASLLLCANREECSFDIIPVVGGDDCNWLCGCTSHRLKVGTMYRVRCDGAEFTVVISKDEHFPTMSRFESYILKSIKNMEEGVDR